MFWILQQTTFLKRLRIEVSAYRLEITASLAFFLRAWKLSEFWVGRPKNTRVSRFTAEQPSSTWCRVLSKVDLDTCEISRGRYRWAQTEFPPLMVHSHELFDFDFPWSIALFFWEFQWARLVAYRCRWHNLRTCIAMNFAVTIFLLICIKTLCCS